MDIERHFTKIKNWILKSLSLTDWWEEVADLINSVNCQKYNDKELAEFRKELMIEKYEVSNEDLPDYIARVDRCLSIALLVEAVILGPMNAAPSYNTYMTMHNAWKNVGWQFVHTLTLSKHGKFFNFFLSCKVERVNLFKVFHVVAIYVIPSNVLYMNKTNLHNS